MPFRKCPKCGDNMPLSHRQCGNCGYRSTRRRSFRRKRARKIL